MAKKPKKKDPEGITTISENRRARRDYQIDETIEVGIALRGTEVKSLRQRHVSFSDAYVSVRGGEMWLIGMVIEPYSHGNIFNHDTDRVRKLLAKKSEIERIQKRIDHRGDTVIPLKIYFKKAWCKILLGIGKGKTKGDKRQDIKQRDANRDMRRALKRG